jgi:hypothetical protein
MSAKSGRTSETVNTPFQNPDLAEPSEVEVTDPRHPLYGRRFCVAAVRRPSQMAEHVLVTYTEGILLRLPIQVTDWVSKAPEPGTKLNRAAIEELVALGTQDELRWAFNQEQSGPVWEPNCKQKSGRRSAR